MKKINSLLWLLVFSSIFSISYSTQMNQTVENHLLTYVTPSGTIYGDFTTSSSRLSSEDIKILLTILTDTETFRALSSKIQEKSHFVNESRAQSKLIYFTVYSIAYAAKQKKDIVPLVDWLILKTKNMKSLNELNDIGMATFIFEDIKYPWAFEEMIRFIDSIQELPKLSKLEHISKKDNKYIDSFDWDIVNSYEWDIVYHTIRRNNIDEYTEIKKHCKRLDKEKDWTKFDASFSRRTTFHNLINAMDNNQTPESIHALADWIITRVKIPRTFDDGDLIISGIQEMEKISSSASFIELLRITDSLETLSREENVMAGNIRNGYEPEILQAVRHRGNPQELAELQKHIQPSRWETMNYVR